jgi:hypothetical protein
LLSTILGVAGLAALVAGMYVLAGLGAGLLTAGCSLILLGEATEGLRLPRPRVRVRTPSAPLTNEHLDRGV